MNLKKIMNLLNFVEKQTPFIHDYQFGYLTSDISLVGNGIEILACFEHNMIKQKRNFDQEKEDKEFVTINDIKEGGSNIVQMRMHNKFGVSKVTSLIKYINTFQKILD